MTPRCSEPVRIIEDQVDHTDELLVLNIGSLRGATEWGAGYSTNSPKGAAQGSVCYTRRGKPDVGPC